MENKNKVTKLVKKYFTEKFNIKETGDDTLTVDFKSGHSIDFISEDGKGGDWYIYDSYHREKDMSFYKKLENAFYDIVDYFETVWPSLVKEEIKKTIFQEQFERIGGRIRLYN